MVAVVLLAKLGGASYSTEVAVCLFKAPGPFSAHVTPFPEESLATTAVIVIVWPCPMVCELPPLKLTEITGGELVPPQLERDTAEKSPINIRTTGVRIWTSVPFPSRSAANDRAKDKAMVLFVMRNDSPFVCSTCKRDISRRKGSKDDGVLGDSYFKWNNEGRIGFDPWRMYPIPGGPAWTLSRLM